MKSKKEELSTSAQRLLYYWYNERETITKLKAEIHNNKTGSGRPNLIKFLTYMKQLNLNSVKDVYDFVDKKWKQS